MYVVGRLDGATQIANQVTMPKTRRGRNTKPAMAKPATLAARQATSCSSLLSTCSAPTTYPPTRPGASRAKVSRAYIAEEPWLHIWPPVMDASVDTAVSAHVHQNGGPQDAQNCVPAEWYAGYDNTGSSHDSLMRGPHRCTGRQVPEWEAVITLASASSPLWPYTMASCSTGPSPSLRSRPHV